MPGLGTEQQIALIYQQESRRILATLIRLLGDFELAEEALQEAFSAAVTQWRNDGIPEQPRAWLISTGRFKAIDKLRRDQRFRELLPTLGDLTEEAAAPNARAIEDDQLRLIFTCCHPALAEPARIALTLREVCGMTTEQIAQAFLQPTSTLAQRIVRAKKKIRQARIPFEIPETTQMTERLDAVLQVIYLVFNEGYFCSSGDALINGKLMDEALRLARQLVRYVQHTEAQGLLALLLFQHSRHHARLSNDGRLLTLEAQNRELWDPAQIQEADTLLREILPRADIGRFTLQAAIAGLHADVKSYAQTDWREILAFYDLLLQRHPSPVVALNRAVVVSKLSGPQAAIELIQELNCSQTLSDYRFFHVFHADLLRQLGDTVAAEQSYRRALTLTPQDSERTYLHEQLNELLTSN
ncbi:RNA polymerase sigma factor [Pseudidiomarina homiensis]|uniref:RNA polymerase subunit sigma-24 n=1 Tax=Pseudidiomarina homiensis TaxID=364198 RepID=A0A432Y6V3_9GAMM|nr:RNA polymerase sigma factor [Pseudidiomarina homiensis]RUO56663.1 RNA polymerase subunit sigma-24 [Pseudidiomarina homiensis]